MQRICQYRSVLILQSLLLYVELACRVTQYPRKLAVIRHTAQSKKSVLPHTLINSKIVYTVVWRRGEREELSSDCLHSLFCHTENILPSKSWSNALPFGDFSYGPERAEISLFSNDFRGFYFSFSNVFCHFRVIIVQILSSEQKFAYRYKTLLRYCLQLKKPYLVWFSPRRKIFQVYREHSLCSTLPP